MVSPFDLARFDTIWSQARDYFFHHKPVVKYIEGGHFIPKSRVERYVLQLLQALVVFARGRVKDLQLIQFGVLNDWQVRRD